VTFVRSSTPVGHPLTGINENIEDDSGAGSLRALGIASRNTTGPSPPRLLHGAVLPQPPGGRDRYDESAHGREATRRRLCLGPPRGTLLGPTARCSRENFREPDDCVLSGHALGEFRLQAGFLHYPAPYVSGLHGPAIFQITHSPEMMPWRLGTGYYDRPIARRIAEEAGVPRENRSRNSGRG
jgi:hypothetical protein